MADPRRVSQSDRALVMAIDRQADRIEELERSLANEHTRVRHLREEIKWANRAHAQAHAHEQELLVMWREAKASLTRQTLLSATRLHFCQELEARIEAVRVAATTKIVHEGINHRIAYSECRTCYGTAEENSHIVHDPDCWLARALGWPRREEE